MTMWLSPKTLLAAVNAVWNHADDGGGAGARRRRALAIGLAVVVGTFVIEIPIGQSAVYYVDVKNPNCSNAAGSGSQSKPYCSLNYAATIASPGDTFLIQSGRYSQGPTVFRRSGTATAPITWRAVGDVTFGLDVRDEDFQPVSGMANVYSIAWTNPLPPGNVSQMRFAPILVDDPNQSKFTMVQEDGPLRLSPVKSDALLVAHEGTWRLNGGQLFVRAYGDRVPSTAATDFVVGVAGGTNFTVESKTQYNVFDGFRVLFSFTVLGSNNTFRNLKFQGQPFTLGGTNNTAENITISHVLTRDETTFSWFTDAQGTAGGMNGSGHRVTNLHAFHNWNSSFSSEGATGVVVDGARLHGAPNHCSIAANGNSIIRNAILYNCQDFEWLIDTNGLTLEHVVLPSGIAFSAVTRTLGPAIVRNSIFQGTFIFVRGTGVAATLPFEGCTWEKGSILENNVISANATIERCADQVTYPILTYMAKCASGEFTDCMTIRNNRMVSDWKTVIKDGMWNATLGDRWDVSLVPNSPAIDAGTVSGAAKDILGVSRPLGTAGDAGIYEYCGPGCPPPAPSSPSVVRVVR